MKSNGGHRRKVFSLRFHFLSGSIGIGGYLANVTASRLEGWTRPPTRMEMAGKRRGRKNVITTENDNEVYILITRRCRQMVSNAILILPLPLPLSLSPPARFATVGRVQRRVLRACASGQRGTHPCTELLHTKRRKRGRGRSRTRGGKTKSMREGLLHFAKNAVHGVIIYLRGPTDPGLQRRRVNAPPLPHRPVAARHESNL